MAVRLEHANLAVDTTGAGGLAFWAKGKLKTEIPD